MKIVLITGIGCFKSLRVITLHVAVLILQLYLGLNIAALSSVKIFPPNTHIFAKTVSGCKIKLLGEETGIKNKILKSSCLRGKTVL